MHTACIQKLSLKTSRQDFWNFVMSQQSRHSAMPKALPTWTHHPISQDLVSLSVYLKSVIFVFITQKTVTVTGAPERSLREEIVKLH